jgi:hypothetical protein
MFWTITFLTIFSIAIQVFNHWFLSKGNLAVAYKLSTVGYTLHMIMDTILAFSSPEQMAVLLFNLVNLWAFIMAVKGWVRLRREGKEKHKVHTVCAGC